MSLGLLFVCFGTSLEAQKTGQKCPVAIERLELGYSHQDGQSKPQLLMRFANRADRRIAMVTFSLSLLDSAGYPHPYPEDLKYQDRLDPHKWKQYTWDLASESVDIHRTGETAVLRKVEFEDAMTWKDDGSESCAMTIDYHPR